MSEIATEPEPAAAPEPTAPGPPDPPPKRPVRMLRVVAVVALVSVVVAGLGLVIGTRPLRTPTQDCGTAFAFLLGGRQNEYLDPNDPPEGVTAREATANNERPCQERAANRAWPAGVLVVGGTLVGIVALLVDWVARFRYRRAVRRWRARPTPTDDPPPTDT